MNELVIGMDLEKVSEDIKAGRYADHEDVALTKRHSSIAVIKPASILVRKTHRRNSRDKLLALLSLNEKKCLKMLL